MKKWRRRERERGKKYVSIPILEHEKVAKVISIQILFQACHEIGIRIE
jgi:hypothetical protein